MKEFNKAKKQLKDYHTGARKSKPTKKILDFLESQGVISKVEDELKGGEMVGGVNRLKKAKRWEGFVKDTAYDAVDLADYGYRKAKAAANPVSRTVSGWFGRAKKTSQSPWISYVKNFSEKNGIPYKEALKAAGPSYRKLKAQM